MAGERSSVAFIQARPVLICATYSALRDLYVEKLGFRLLEEVGDPPKFGIFRAVMRSCSLTHGMGHGFLPRKLGMPISM